MMKVKQIHFPLINFSIKYKRKSRNITKNLLDIFHETGQSEKEINMRKMGFMTFYLQSRSLS